MSARINGITNSNNDVAIENNMKVLPLVREEYYLTIESYNKLLENDISFLANVSVSGNIIPLNSVTSDLGSISKYWSNAYINNLNVTNFVTTIDASYLSDNTITSAKIANNTIIDDDISLNAQIAFNKINTINAIMNSDISANASITSNKIDSSGTWSFVNISATFGNITDISVTNISVSGNLEPLYANNTSKLGSSVKLWRNAYINDISANNISATNISATNISISGNITIPNETITSSHIKNLTIVNNDISTNADISGSKLADASITSTKIDSSGIWSFVNISANFGNIRDLSATNMTISGNLEPNSNLSGSLGVSGNMWGNAYICDLDVSNITTNAFNIGNIAFTISGNTLILRLKTL